MWPVRYSILCSLDKLLRSAQAVLKILGEEVRFPCPLSARLGHTQELVRNGPPQPYRRKLAGDAGIENFQVVADLTLVHRHSRQFRPSQIHFLANNP